MELFMNESGYYLTGNENTKNIIHAIKNFNLVCENFDLCKVPRKSIISHHDQTIRFTNSTSSVLKKFLSGEKKIIEPGYYLVQPAMGLQGFDLWVREKEVEYFTSFFYSMGAIFAPDKMDLSVSVVLKLLNSLNLIDEVTIFLSPNQEDLADCAQMIGLPVQVDSIGTYTHTFGIPYISGRHMEFKVMVGNQSIYIGSLIIVEDERTQEITAIEVSFDSTLLISAMKKISNPILSLPCGGTCTEKLSINNVEWLAFVDTLYLSTVLMMDGLVPSGRGRGRNLRSIIIENKKLRNLLNLTDYEFQSLLFDCFFAEQVIRKCCLGEETYRTFDYILDMYNKV